MVVGIDRHRAYNVARRNRGGCGGTEVEEVVREEAEQQHEYVMGGACVSPCSRDEESFASDLEQEEKDLAHQY